MGQGSEFWRFSLAFYGREGVPAACVALQDAHGLDVNVMLFALWLASRGRVVSASDLAHADDVVSGWRRDAVIPLRGVRRFLKTPPEAVEGAGAAGLRTRVKALELEAERLQQEALFALRPVHGWGAPAEAAEAARRNMEACAAAFGVSFEPAHVAAILEAFRNLTTPAP